MNDVLVIGAGPVGLSLGVCLARSGVNVTVLEARDQLSDEARASTIHPPTLEFWRQLGVADRVVSAGIRVDRLQYWERGSRELLAEFDYGLIAGDTPYPFRLQCPQATVIPLLAAEFEAAGGRLLFGHKLTGLTQDASGVDATIEGPNETYQHRCTWLAGCDGASSAVRQVLEIPFPGKTYEDRFLLTSTNLALDPVYPGIGPVAYIFDPREWVIVMQVPGATRVVFRLHPEEDATAAQESAALRARLDRFVGGNVRYTIHSSRIYRVHQRVAAEFRQGRVLLAGDAAHINNPAGGMGMNSGVHDARDLGEAFITLFQNGDPASLDHYATTRRAMAVAGVQAHTDQHYGELSTTKEEKRLARNEAYRAAARDPNTARQWVLERAMLAGRAGGQA
ncbi:MAG: FAD-dependent oxidoreductase [Myxococcota bacterium]|nr:FAD-dependent oxidoreductase [Myxococcota bacterium]